eukprot:4933671-Amphidinium_carterae.1
MRAKHLKTLADCHLDLSALDFEGALETVITNTTREEHSKGIQSWKKRLSDAEDVFPRRPHQYVTSKHRARFVGLLGRDRQPISAERVDTELAAFWDAIESPPGYSGHEASIKVLAAFPVEMGHIVEAKFPTVDQVQHYIKHMKATTAAGPDGWKQKEIAALLKQAIEEFIGLMLSDIASRTYSRGLLDCKVSKIPKDSSAPALGKLRPIS